MHPRKNVYTWQYRQDCGKCAFCLVPAVSTFDYDGRGFLVTRNDNDRPFSSIENPRVIARILAHLGQGAATALAAAHLPRARPAPGLLELR